MKTARERPKVAGAWLALGSGQGTRETAPPEAVLLDPVIHERTRLAILTALATAPEGERSFMDLRDALKLTDGNLLTHLRTLDAARLVDCVKTGAGRGSNTTVRLTAAGRQRFRTYLDRLEALIRAARG